MARAQAAGLFDNLPSNVTGVLPAPPETGWEILISSISHNLIPAAKSFLVNGPELATYFGLTLLGVVLFLLTGRSHPQFSLIAWCGISFVIFTLVSFLKGYVICRSCPLLYSQYLFGLGVIGGACGLATFFGNKTYLRMGLVGALFALTVFTSIQSLKKLNAELFKPEHKHDVMELANSINALVPKNEEILPLGFLGRPQPIRLGLFLADRFFRPSMLNPSFTFRPYPISILLSEEDKAYLEKTNFWSPPQLVDWVENKYNYVIKPTHLYFDDHNYRFWFRRVFFPVEAKLALAKNFHCSQIPGNFMAIPPIDLCVRKTPL